MGLFDKMPLRRYRLHTSNPAYVSLEEKPIAFFCAEYSIDDRLQNFSGGLGVLAGDFVLEAGAEGLPFVAIGLFYHFGSQTVGTNLQRLQPTEYDFELLRDEMGQPHLLRLDVNGENIAVKTWVRIFGTAHLFLLDTDVPENSQSARELTDYLYDERSDVHAAQLGLIGLGGVLLLRSLGLAPSVYHLNEARTSLVAFALALEHLERVGVTRRFFDAQAVVRQSVVATKHTILPNAGQHFDRPTLRRLLGSYLHSSGASFEEFFALGLDDDHPDVFSTTKYLLTAARQGNAVSALHAVSEKKEHPHSRLLSITNGVYEKRWRHASSVVPLSEQSLAEGWQQHQAARADLVRLVKTLTGRTLDDERLTLVWARRIVPYKNPDALFHDLARLEALVNHSTRPIQVVLAGLARQADVASTRLLQDIVSHTEDVRFNGRVVYVPTYDIASAKGLVGGADVWLSTSERGQEACGTSGMKAGLNGTLLCSTSDGWVDEVNWKGIGWTLPDNNIAETLYELLEKEISPLFYARNVDGVPEEWLKRMRLTEALVREHFTTKRMLAEYQQKLYFPSAL